MFDGCKHIYKCYQENNDTCDEVELLDDEAGQQLRQGVGQTVRGLETVTGQYDCVDAQGNVVDCSCGGCCESSN